MFSNVKFGRAFALPLVAALGCATGPQFARSQSVPAQLPGGDSIAVLLPGAPELATSALHAESITYHVVADTGAGTPTRPFGAGRREIHPTTYAGAPALLLVSSTHAGKAYFGDSTLVRRDGLAPIWEVSTVGAWRRRVDYDGRRVHAVATSADSSISVSHEYPRPVFHASEIDVVVRAVPLVPGYRVVLPVYSPVDDAVETDTISVARGDRDGVWDVRFADPVIVSHYAIASSRTVVGRTITRQDHRRLRLHFVEDTTAGAVAYRSR